MSAEQIVNVLNRYIDARINYLTDFQTAKTERYLREAEKELTELITELQKPEMPDHK